mmetsp:Transcript_51651/g.160811  ORF Transcript_51651/g.160811 Transcript_51651/m.160811 type:complete len:206 (+) Transcript_51651:50-667(+)
MEEEGRRRRRGTRDGDEGAETAKGGEAVVHLKLGLGPRFPLDLILSPTKVLGSSCRFSRMNLSPLCETTSLLMNLCICFTSWLFICSSARSIAPLLCTTGRGQGFPFSTLASSSTLSYCSSTRWRMAPLYSLSNIFLSCSLCSAETAMDCSWRCSNKRSIASSVDLLVARKYSSSALLLFGKISCMLFNSSDSTSSHSCSFLLLS